MTDFCIEAITPEAGLRARHGVLRSASFAVTSDARVAAQRILHDARSEAEAILKTSRDDAQQAVQEAERQTLQRGAQLLQSLQEEHEAFLQRAQDMVIDLAQGLFDRLVAEMTPRERIAAALKRVQNEAPPRLVTPMLRVHPDDVELLPVVDWELKPDASLARGTCRLEAGNGEWCANFDAALDAMRTAFAVATQETDESLGGA